MAATAFYIAHVFATHEAEILGFSDVRNDLVAGCGGYEGRKFRDKLAKKTQNRKISYTTVITYKF